MKIFSHTCSLKSSMLAVNLGFNCQYSKVHYKKIHISDQSKYFCTKETIRETLLLIFSCTVHNSVKRFGKTQSNKFSIDLRNSGALIMSYTTDDELKKKKKKKVTGVCKFTIQYFTRYNATESSLWLYMKSSNIKSIITITNQISGNQSFMNKANKTNIT